MPPALLPLLDPAELTELRCVIVAGEASGPEQVARWSAGGRHFQNWYGPTEATVCVTGSELTGRWDRPLPIGRPLPNHRGYILDEQLRPVPPGEPGELYVSGPGLARGYLNRPGQTAERFLPDPFSEQPGARMYRTGDLVTWEPDGRIGFLGRIDRQFKIAGQRVEAGEVEAALRAHPAVAQAVVDVRPGSSGPPELTAYLTPATAPDLAAVREFCADRLPTYMLPHRVVRLDRLPLNASSKVDLVALRAFPAAWGPDGGEPVGSGRRPATPAQRAVAAAWSRVFGSPEPSLDDDFFAAGGHSLLAMRLGALLRAEQQREFAVDDVFLGHTVEGLARRLEAAPPVEATAVPTDRLAALSAAQRRLWFLDRLSEDTSAYNIAVAERLRGPLDPAALRAALAMVAERQQILRWRVSERDSRPGVAVAPPGAVELPVVDLTDAAPGRPGVRAWVDPGGADADPAAAVRAELRAEASRRFDLARGPLWRARLLRLGRDDHVLASDPAPPDLRRLVAGRALPRPRRLLPGRPRRPGPVLATLPTGYADYVGWRSEQQDRRGRADLDWWLSTLDGVPTRCWTCPGTGPGRRCRPTGASGAGIGPGGGRRRGSGSWPADRSTTPYSGAAGRLRRAAAPPRRGDRPDRRCGRGRPPAPGVRRPGRLVRGHRAGPAADRRRRGLRRAGRPVPRTPCLPRWRIGTRRSSSWSTALRLPRDLSRDAAGPGAVQHATTSRSPGSTCPACSPSRSPRAARLAVRHHPLRHRAGRRVRPGGRLQPGPVRRGPDRRAPRLLHRAAACRPGHTGCARRPGLGPTARPAAAGSGPAAAHAPTG